MLFTAEPTVTPDDTEASPKVEMLKLAHGIITWVSVLFPTGCHQMVHCAILHHEHQIWPSTENMSLSGDGVPIEWTEYYEVYHPPYELKIKLWSEETTYDHTVTVRIAVLPRKAIVAASLTDALKGLFGMLLPRRIIPPSE